MQLQTQLQELAAADAVATHAFTLQREKLARESHAIAERLRQLQGNAPPQQVHLPFNTSQAKPALPPHLTQTIAPTGLTPDTSRHLQGLAGPQTLAPGLAEPVNLALGPTVPSQTVQCSGAPRPEEAVHE